MSVSVQATPDPDKMYNVSDAVSYTDSPLVEVFDHNVNAIRRQIQSREDVAVGRLNAMQKAREAITAQPQTPTNVYYTEPSPVITDPTTDKMSPLPPFEMRTCSQLNAQLHRGDFANRVNRQPNSWKLDAPPCVQRSCPFCRGPLLLQRFSLLQRLYQLNVLLYGHIEALDDLKKY